MPANWIVVVFFVAVVHLVWLVSLRLAKTDPWSSFMASFSFGSGNATACRLDWANSTGHSLVWFDDGSRFGQTNELDKASVPVGAAEGMYSVAVRWWYCCAPWLVDPTTGTSALASVADWDLLVPVLVMLALAVHGGMQLARLELRVDAHWLTLGSTSDCDLVIGTHGGSTNEAHYTPVNRNLVGTTLLISSSFSITGSSSVLVLLAITILIHNAYSQWKALKETTKAVERALDAEYASTAYSSPEPEPRSEPDSESNAQYWRTMIQNCITLANFQRTTCYLALLFGICLRGAPDTGGGGDIMCGAYAVLLFWHNTPSLVGEERFASYDPQKWCSTSRMLAAMLVVRYMLGLGFEPCGARSSAADAHTWRHWLAAEDMFGWKLLVDGLVLFVVSTFARVRFSTKWALEQELGQHAERWNAPATQAVVSGRVNARDKSLLTSNESHLLDDMYLRAENHKFHKDHLLFPGKLDCEQRFENLKGGRQNVLSNQTSEPKDPRGAATSKRPISQRVADCLGMHVLSVYDGLVTMLVASLAFASYQPFDNDLLSLTYVYTAIVLLHEHRRIEHTDGRISALMAFATASLLVQCAFQLPIFDSCTFLGDVNARADETDVICHKGSWQNVMGVHKFRADNAKTMVSIWLAGVCMCIAICLKVLLNTTTYLKALAAEPKQRDDEQGTTYRCNYLNARDKQRANAERSQPKQPLRAAAVLPTYSCLQVALLECRRLKKVDGRFGSKNVFVTLDLDGDVQKSSTIDDGGEAPAWQGGAGESFAFGASDPPKRLRVEAFDEDVGSADDSIGSHTVDLASIVPGDQDWSSCEWYDLEDEKGKAAGEVRLFMRWGVPAATDAPREWQLQVTVLECDGLKKMDLTAQNDVYVKLEVDGAEEPHRSSTIEGGGTAPVWSEGAGETMTFRLGAAPPSVGIEVYDEDQGSADDLIGTHVLEIGVKLDMRANPKSGGWSLQNWFDIVDRRGNATGRVRLRLEWKWQQGIGEALIDWLHSRANGCPHSFVPTLFVPTLETKSRPASQSPNHAGPCASGLDAAVTELGKNQPLLGQLVSKLDGRLADVARAALLACYGQTAVLCVVALSINFVVHMDTPSFFVFFAWFAYCGVVPATQIDHESVAMQEFRTARQQAHFWQFCITLIEVRILFVKFLSAWPTSPDWSKGEEGFYGINLAQFDGFIDMNANAVWDWFLLLMLLLHQRRCVRQGEWVTPANPEGGWFTKNAGLRRSLAKFPGIYRGRRTRRAFEHASLFLGHVRAPAPAKRNVLSSKFDRCVVAALYKSIEQRDRDAFDDLVWCIHRTPSAWTQGYWDPLTRGWQESPLADGINKALQMDAEMLKDILSGFPPLPERGSKTRSWLSSKVRRSFNDFRSGQQPATDFDRFSRFKAVKQLLRSGWPFDRPQKHRRIWHQGVDTYTKMLCAQLLCVLLAPWLYLNLGMDWQLNNVTTVEVQLDFTMEDCPSGSCAYTVYQSSAKVSPSGTWSVVDSLQKFYTNSYSDSDAFCSLFSGTHIESSGLRYGDECPESSDLNDVSHCRSEGSKCTSTLDNSDGKEAVQARMRSQGYDQSDGPQQIVNIRIGQPAQARCVARTATAVSANLCLCSCSAGR
eukprot:COSAG04_NODE_979_length_9034_cov_2.941354_2_plen_1608_part_00